MKGAKDLLDSERGWFCLFCLFAATVMAVLKIITGSEWLTFAKWLMVGLVTSKTITGALAPDPVPPPAASS